MSALDAFLGCVVLLLGILLVIQSGDTKHAERRLAAVRAERDLLRSRITTAAEAAAPRPAPPPLPRRPTPRTDPPLTDLEAQAWADITNHLNLEQP